MIDPRDYKYLIAEATAAMIEKLQENDHKSSLYDIDILYAKKRIVDETNELLQSFLKKTKDHEFDYYSIRREAADVANFAAMIIHACNNRLKISTPEDEMQEVYEERRCTLEPLVREAMDMIRTDMSWSEVDYVRTMLRSALKEVEE